MHSEALGTSRRPCTWRPCSPSVSMFIEPWGMGMDCDIGTLGCCMLGRCRLLIPGGGPAPMPPELTPAPMPPPGGPNIAGGAAGASCVASDYDSCRRRCAGPRSTRSSKSGTLRAACGLAGKGNKGGDPCKPRNPIEKGTSGPKSNKSSALDFTCKSTASCTALCTHSSKLSFLRRPCSDCGRILS